MGARNIKDKEQITEKSLCWEYEIKRFKDENFNSIYPRSGRHINRDRVTTIKSDEEVEIR
jgi:hypothetical protein